MKTARRANLEGALIGKLVTIVRGERYFTIPSRELRDLADLLRDLDDAALATVAPSAVRVTTIPAPAPAVVTPTPEPKPAAAPPAAPKAAVAPVVASVAAPVVEAPVKRRPGRPKASAAAPATTTQRRGRVWEGIQALIRAEGPQSYDQIRAMVEREGLTDRDVDHAVKIAIGKKRSAGDLLELPGGLYTVPGGATATAPVVDEQPAAAGADKRRHRPGALWQSMRAHLAKFPEGLTDKEIVAATAANGWTTATDPSHAVKICLTRVRDQLERTSAGRYRLVGMAPVAPAPESPEPSTVRVRKKRTEAKADEPVEAPKAEEPPVATTSDEEAASAAEFDAARHYPTKRRARAV